MTKLMFINFFIVQWFFIRLAKHVNGKNIVGWSFMGFVLPLTGWWSNYIWLSKVQHLFIKKPVEK